MPHHTPDSSATPSTPTMPDAVSAWVPDTVVDAGSTNPIPDPHLHAPLAPDALEPATSDVPNGFVALNLAAPLVQACVDMGFAQPTHVQAKAIPLALAGDPDADDCGADSRQDKPFVDLMVSSQTGSGKTAAFLLPVLHTLLQQQQAAEEAARADWQRKVDEAAANGEAPPKKPRRKNPTDRRHFKAAEPGALVLCPTRELAQQVAHDAIDLVRHCKGLRIAHVVGGMPYAMQIARLQNANLVVATPGRLLDLQRSMQIRLEKVQFLVVDEADRMLDLGFADDLADIHQLTAQRRQTMMFSATFAPRIQQLAARIMREPQKIEIDTAQQKHRHIEQRLYWADNFAHKRALLDHWLRDPAIEQAIVFASTQMECDGLAQDLQEAGFATEALHGALSQGLRNRRLQALRQGRIQILVATDVAARGIDVPGISHVFNFGLPMKAEDYTHRIGRTGRAGRNGLAITLAEYRDRGRVWDIEDFTHQPLMTAIVPGLEPQERTPSRHPPKGKGRNGKAPGKGFGRKNAGKGYGKGLVKGFGDAGNFGKTGDRHSPRARAHAADGGYGGGHSGHGDYSAHGGGRKPAYDNPYSDGRAKRADAGHQGGGYAGAHGGDHRSHHRGEDGYPHHTPGGKRFGAARSPRPAGARQDSRPMRPPRRNGRG